MIKFCLGSEFWFKKLSRIPLLNKFVTYDLYRLNHIKDKNTFSQVINNISLKNGTFKTTLSNRFEVVDNYIVEVLSGSTNHIKVHDVAVSDGLTSYEFHEKLKRNFIPVEFHISDKYFKLLSARHFGIKRYYTTDHHFISANIWGVLASLEVGKKYLISWLLGRLFSKLSFPRKLSNTILILTPLVKDAVTKNEIHLHELDLFQEWDNNEKYDVVRCMNILNPLYFTYSQLEIALKNLRNSITKGGIFIVGRTDIHTLDNYVSIYRNDENKWILIKEFNGGSEINDFILTQLQD